MARRYLVLLFMLLIAPALALSAQQAQDGQSKGTPGGPALRGVDPAQMQERIQKRIQELEKRLNLSDADLQRIENTTAPFKEQIRQASADIAVIRAQVARELVNDKPDIEKIRALVKKSLDLELTVRMAEIQRQLAVRDVIGQDKWLAVAEALKERLGPMMHPMPGTGENKLFKLLEQFQGGN